MRQIHTQYSVVIADDHQIVREGIKQSLREATTANFTVIAEATNGLEAIAAVTRHKPDLLLLDVSMPHAGGAEILGDIRRWSPATRIVVFTGVTALGVLATMLRTGVDGLFSKGGDFTELVEKLPLIAGGGRYITPALRDALDNHSMIPELSPREHQTLSMIVAGKSNKEIARVMAVSPKTVDKHRTNLMTKLNVHSVAELLAYALREGLIEPNR